MAENTGKNNPHVPTAGDGPLLSGHLSPELVAAARESFLEIIALGKNATDPKIRLAANQFVCNHILGNLPCSPSRDNTPVIIKWADPPDRK